MNNDAFLRLISDSRDCEQSQLSKAINKGLNRARNDRLDSKKILMLAAACLFTFVMCITSNLRPFQEAADGYYQYRNNSMPGSTEVLAGYINDIAGNLKRFIGE